MSPCPKSNADRRYFAMDTVNSQKLICIDHKRVARLAWQVLDDLYRIAFRWVARYAVQLDIRVVWSSSKEIIFVLLD
jgi:hypothetical protein